MKLYFIIDGFGYDYIVPIKKINLFKNTITFRKYDVWDNFSFDYQTKLSNFLKENIVNIKRDIKRALYDELRNKIKLIKAYKEAFINLFKKEKIDQNTYITEEDEEAFRKISEDINRELHKYSHVEPKNFFVVNQKKIMHKF